MGQRFGRRGSRLALGMLLAAGALLLVVRGASGAETGQKTAAAFLEEEVRRFSGIRSRVSGTPGCDEAADYIVARFRALGLKNVTVQPFDVTVPVTKRCVLDLGPERRRVEIHPLWPNWVRTCSTPGPITCPIVYAYDGDLRQLSGLGIAGAIVVMEHNTGSAWLGLAALGARAVVFVEPEAREATRRHAEQKFLREPVNVPRFWVPRAGAGVGAGELVREVEAAQKKGSPLTATLDCRVDWEPRTGKNIFGLLEGTEGTVDRGNFVAFTAHCDSMSIAPDVAPGADAAGSVAALLRLAEHLRSNPIPESVLFVALSGHYEALAGSRALADTLAYSNTVLPDGRRAEIDEVRARIEALGAKQLERAAQLREYEDVVKRLAGIADLDEQVASESGKAIRWLRAGPGAVVEAEQLTRALDPGKVAPWQRMSIVERVALLPKQVPAGKPVPPEKVDELVNLYVSRWLLSALDSDELSLRLRRLEDDKIDWFGRSQAYKDRIAGAVLSARGIGTVAVAECEALLESAREVEEKAGAAEGVGVSRLKQVLKDAGEKGLLTSEVQRELRSAMDEAAAADPRAQASGPDRMSRVRAVAARLKSAVEGSTEARRSVQTAMLDAVTELQRKLTTTTSSYGTYQKLYALLRQALDAGLISTNTERNVRYAVERRQDADRHIVVYRFELMRLRKNADFLGRLKLDLKKRLRLVYSFDLSGDGWRFGMFPTTASSLVSEPVAEQGIYGALMQRIWQFGRKRVDDLPREPGQEARLYERIAYPVQASERMKGEISGYFNGRVAFDSEVFQLAGREALALATVDCAHRRIDTPTDTAERMKAVGGFDRLATQVDLLCELVQALASDPQTLGLYQSFDAARASGRAPLREYFCRANGRVVLYDVRESLGAADVPVPGVLCATRYCATGEWSAGEGAKTYNAIRDGFFTFADEGGTYEVVGVPHASGRAWNMKDFIFEAYGFDRDGEISFAPDLGAWGKQQFNFVQVMKEDNQEITVPVFACRPVGLLGFTSPLSARPYSGSTLYDAKTNTTPDFFGQSLYSGTAAQTQSMPTAVVFMTPGSRFKLQFTSGALGPTAPLANVRREHMAEDGPAAGYGYDLPPAGVLANPRYLMTRDVVLLDDHRIGALREHAVENRRVTELHEGRKDKEGNLVWEGAVQRLERAEAAAAARQHAKAAVHLEAAYATESRAYPIIKGTTSDILTGVVFYLFLLLPFSYFAERLLFGFPSVNRRIAASFIIFLAVFLVLALVHPAFAITHSAPVILIAFITLALSLLVISMVRSRFELEIKRLHERPGARRQTDFTRASATSAACALGIGNMRRRKVRTGLTLATLVLLTFSVLSFTSVEPRRITHVNPNPTGEEIIPAYAGVLLRDYRYAPIGTYLFDLVQNEFSEEAIIAPRAWLATDALVQSPKDPRLEFLCTGVVGMRPEETEVIRLDAHILRPGRWFRADDREPACIIGQDVARRVGITADQVTGELRSAPRIRVLGVDLPVIGITDDDQVRRLKDIDGEKISPIDRRTERWEKRSGKQFDPYAVETYTHVGPENCMFVPFDFLLEYGAEVMSVAVVPKRVSPVLRQQLLALAEKGMTARGELADLEGVHDAARLAKGIDDSVRSQLAVKDALLRMADEIKPEDERRFRPTRAMLREVADVRIGEALRRGDQAKTAAAKGEGAEVRNLAASVGGVVAGLQDAIASEPERATEFGENLLSRLTIPIYVSDGTGVRYCLSSDANRVRGFGSMIVPMLICSLIVLNTMLGSVYERQREISIFGSLGLAPIHIGSLFMAESAVYGTVAVILGYVLGQATSFLLTANRLLEGFSLNYSSTSAVVSAAAVMALVLLSTLYPARKASQLSVPDVERIWKLPPPEGDRFHIKFPFTIGGQQAHGINMFLLEYFQDHANQSVGDFFAQDSVLRFEKVGGAEVMRFDSQVWIAPFDFGISQSMTLYTMPTDEAGIFAPEMDLVRKSGAPAAWARMNHRFLKLIRQQFLMWRILTTEEREHFAAQARVHLGIATEADRQVVEQGAETKAAAGAAAPQES